MWPRRRRQSPLVSLIMCTRNGMPYVREAIASVAALRYRPYELVVQDCVSTDGTAEFLANLEDVEGLSFVSEPDDGIGEAYNRAVARCRGEIIGSIDADNLVHEDALDIAVGAFEMNPQAAALYGSVVMIDADRTTRETFVPEPFDPRAVMRCEVVPPFSASFFSRVNCGDELCFDERLATCADYDLWLRLSERRIDRVPEALGITRVSAKSMSQHAQRFEQFCADKIAGLTAHFERWPHLSGERDETIAGIYCWAAESIGALEGESEIFDMFVGLAGRHDPDSERYRRLTGSVASSTPELS